MKNTTIILLLLLSFSIQAQNYTFSNLTGTYSDLTGTTSISNGEIWDDPEYTLALPFPFVINGSSMNSINVSDGFITQNASTTILQTLAPLAMDLLDRGDNGTTSLSPISYKTDGTVGNRILKIEYKNCGSFYDANLTMFINFQVWLYESTNIIEYRYGPNSITNASIFYDGDTGAVVGLGGSDINENISNAHFLVSTASNPTLSTSVNIIPITGTPPANTIYRFTPTTLNNSEISSSLMTLYPNPFNDYIVIEGLKSNFSFDIYNVSGKLIQSNQEATSGTQIDTKSFQSGIYILKIVSENETIVKKIIKM
jgi:hypothetical protein